MVYYDNNAFHTVRFTPANVEFTTAGGIMSKEITSQKFIKQTTLNFPSLYRDIYCLQV